MKRVMIFSLLCLLTLVSFTTASLGTYPVNSTVPIKVLSNCSDVNLTEVNGITLNVPMVNIGGQTFLYNYSNTSQVGQYSFSSSPSCLSCTEDTCLNTFDVTLSGESLELTAIVSDIVLLLCMFLILVLITRKHEKVNFEVWDKNIIKNHKNMGQTFINSLLYTLFKNSFIWLYFLGWICVLILRDIIFRFNSVQIYNYFVLFANIYSLGLILVVIFMIGTFASYMKGILEILAENNWGLGDGE